jgi:hypothetical protein
VYNEPLSAPLVVDLATKVWQSP